MAYVSKNDKLLKLMIGKTLDEIEELSKSFKNSAFSEYVKEKKTSISNEERFGKVCSSLFIAPVYVRLYAVGNEVYVFVFTHSRNEVIAYFNKSNLVCVEMFLENHKFLTDIGYKESTIVTTRSKIRAMLTQAKEFKYSNKKAISRLLVELSKKIEPPVPVSVVQPVPTLASFEETVPANTALKYIIEIEPTDLDATCKALNSIGVKFTLHNKFN